MTTYGSFQAGLIESPELTVALNVEIGEDETLMWSGTPNAARVNRDGTTGFIGAAVSFTIIPLICLLLYVFFGASWLPFLILIGGIVSIYAAIIGLFTLFLTTRRLAQRRRTIYAVTDKRAVILVNGRNKTVKSYTSAQFDDIERQDKQDGTSDLLFLQYHFGNVCKRQSECFYAIARARDAEHSLRALATGIR